jgi:hypothetical protein
MIKKSECTGAEKFVERYGIEFGDLVEIPTMEDSRTIYNTNYRVLYDKCTDRCFRLWQTPQPSSSFILIEDQGFITQDDDIRDEYAAFIQNNFKM